MTSNVQDYYGPAYLPRQMSSSPINPTLAVSIFSIPPELIEKTLIICAQKSPASIAAFSQTCRYYHDMVYQTADHHLWREIFLTTFDDPRPLRSYLRRAGPNGLENLDDDDTAVAYDWDNQYMARISAAQYIQQHLDPRQPKDDKSLITSLRAMISVIFTSVPFPVSPRVIDFTLSMTPAFPPLVLVRSAPFPFPPAFKSLNAEWIDNIVHRGYPSVLTHRLFIPLSANKIEFPQDHKDDHRDSQETAMLFNKLVFLRGFIPSNVPGVLEDPGESSRPALRSAASQSQQVRGTARSTVYNMRYPQRSRCWGPFLPITSVVKRRTDVLAGGQQTEPVIIADEMVKIEDNFWRQVDNAIAVGSMPFGIDESDDDDDFDDDDYQPGLDLVEDDGDDDDEDDEDVLVPPWPLQLTDFDPQDPTTENKLVISRIPHFLIPDYAFLAAARVLVEMNLREMLTDPTNDADRGDLGKVIDALGCMELTRMGGAPGFWDSWVEKDEDEKNASILDIASNKGKAKARIAGDVEGWDWAGVAGQWRRSVCWLDYHDLLLTNLSTMRSADMEETVRIFPLTLRVSGYSRPPNPLNSGEDMYMPKFPSDPDLDSLVWKLPIIHVEGQSQGSDVDENAIRHIKGTVRMIGDGAVRWSLSSSLPNSNDTEWVTEGVQIGGIGSAIGILGMWTGSEHARTDPLGPFWAWKVAPE